MKTKLLLLIISLSLFNKAFAVLNTPNQIAPGNGALNQNVNAILDWDAITGATNYNYQIDTSPAFNSNDFFNGNVSGSSQVTLANLKFGTTYYWKVRAMKNTAPIDSSLWSATFSFTTLNNIDNVAPADGALNQEVNAILDWVAVSGITGYLYQYDTSPAFNTPDLYNGSISGTSQVTLANLQFGTTYYWRVRAYNAADTSNYGPVWSFTTVNTLVNIAPADGALNQEVNAILDWGALSGLSGYLYQYDTSPAFNTPNLYNGSISGTSQVTLANLQFGTTYYWRVRAYNAADTSNYGPVWSFTTVNTLVNIAPADGALNQEVNAILDWGALSGLSGYLYQYDTSPAFNTPNLFNGSISGTSQVTLANLQFGTTYYWRVRAYNAADTSNYGPVWSFTTVNNITHLLPTNGSVGVSLAPVLDWSALGGITGYQYRYSEDSTFATANYGILGAVSQVSLSGLLYGTRYFWNVRAFHASDTSDWSAPWNFTINYQMTLAPALISPSNGTANLPLNGVQLEIGTVSNATDYQYQISTNANFSSYLYYGAAGLTLVIGSLNPSTTYYWRARGHNAAGNSPWASPYTFTTVAGAPPMPNNVGPLDASINIDWLNATISWTTVPGATSYVLLFDDNAGFSSPLNINSTDNFYETGLLNPNTTYYWQVQSVNASGSSAFSSIWSFTTGPVPEPVLTSPVNNASAIAITGTTLNWIAVPSATSYFVEYADNASFSGAMGVTVATNNYNLPVLLNNQTYFWHVYTNYNSFSSVFSAVFSFTTEAANILQAPQLLNPSNLALAVPVTGTYLEWQSVSGALSYDWEISTDATFTTFINGNSLSTTTLMNTLTSNTNYFWHVRSVDADTVSEWSNTFSFTTDILSGLTQNDGSGKIIWQCSGEQLNLQFPDKYIDAEYAISNNLGQVIAQGNILNSFHSWNVIHWSKGVYSLKLALKNEVTCLKLIIP